MRRLDMELEIPYHSDTDGFGCNDDSILSYMFGTFAFPNEKRKEHHSNYALTKGDKKIVNSSDGYPPTVFPDNLEVSYRPGQFSNDLIVISSAVKDLNCDPLKGPNLDGNGREILTLEKEKVNGTMSSEVDVGGDFYPWSNDYKIEANNLKKVGESNNGYLSSGSVTDSVNTPVEKKRIWVVKNRGLESSPRKKKKIRTENGKDSLAAKEGGGCRMPPWHVDEIEDMAADLDGSLSALSTDLTAASYNMSEALLSLPSLTVFKQEAPSPSQEGVLHHPNLQQNIEESHDHNTALQRLLQPQHNFHSQTKKSNSNTIQSKTSDMSEKSENCRFQYVLAAATSIATKLTEETLTYLNQGQSYEIKLKKVGELSNFRGKILKSVIRICFHERRLQYMEKEQILAWQASRPGERIVELDVPLSYGLFDVEQDPHMLNMLSFLWDPTKEVGAYIKVNCISTEFTPKKHGGEKGVPFRIQVETFIEGETTRLHAAACQIKVFKLKGADRKHKQDREKILKRPLSEQDKYQPPYECTVLSDLSPDAVFPAPTFLNSPSTAVLSKPNMILSTLDGKYAIIVRFVPLSKPGDIEIMIRKGRRVRKILPKTGIKRRGMAWMLLTGASTAGDTLAYSKGRMGLSLVKGAGLSVNKQTEIRISMTVKGKEICPIVWKPVKEKHHTIAVSGKDLVFKARFRHAFRATFENRRPRVWLLGKEVAVSMRRRKNMEKKRIFGIRRFNTRHNFSAMEIDSNLGGHSPLRSPISASVVSSSNKIDNGVVLSDILVERSRSPAPLPLECSKSLVSQLTPESNPQQTAQWLRKNSFGNYISTFANFSGADILRLTRDDLIQICGLADGIRLLYALHSKAIVRLTVYFCTPGSTVFHAVYLNQIGRNEMARKLGSLLGIHYNQIRDIYMQGPNGIRVLITDEVVGNIKDESVFYVKVLKDENCDRFVLLLKPASGGT